MGQNTDQNEIGKRLDGVGTLDRWDRLHPEMATVAGEPDPESELVCRFDSIHFVPRRLNYSLWKLSAWFFDSLGVVIFAGCFVAKYCLVHSAECCSLLHRACLAVNGKLQTIILGFRKVCVCTNSGKVRAECEVSEERTLLFLRYRLLEYCACTDALLFAVFVRTHNSLNATH